MNTSPAAARPVVPVLKRRLRALTHLAVVTSFAVLLAAITIWQRASTGEPEFKPEPVFATLRARAEEVATIRVETKAQAFNITRTAQGAWVLPDKSGYRADFNSVRRTILSLVDLQLVERRTARADWHERLGLGLPKKGGSGTLVTLKDGKGEVLATLITGASVEGASAGGRQALYVRRPEQNQTFVARGTLDIESEQARWLDQTFIDLARDRVKTAAMKPFKGRPYSVTRAKPEDENFVLVEAIPPGRVLRSEAEPNGIGNALLGMSFDDVQPLSKVDFAGAAQAAFATFDGLSLSLSLIEKERDFWITITAAADPSLKPPTPPGVTSSKLKPDVAKEAKEINALVAGWAYKIPRYKGTLLTAPLEDLLKPVGAPPAGPTVDSN